MKWLWRTLAVLASIVVLSIAGLFAAGLRSGAGRAHASIDIAKPPSRVWAWATEPDKLKSWISWVVEVRPMQPGPPAVGAKQVWVMQDAYNGNARMQFVDQVTSVEPNRSITVHIDAEGAFSGDSSFTLTDLGNGHTRFENTGTFRYSQWFARLLEPLVTPQAEKKMSMDLQKLKTLVEAEP